jgi:hypothetical protein
MASPVTAVFEEDSRCDDEEGLADDKDDEGLPAAAAAAAFAFSLSLSLNACSRAFC